MDIRKFVEAPDFSPATWGEKSLAGLLKLISVFYGLGVNFRNWAFDRGTFPGRKLPLPVISVGNLTVGGTGKTPMVARIARQLLAKGLKPGILSRGYGRADEKEILILQGSLEAIDYQKLGDEPELLLHQLPGITLALGADRYQAAKETLGKFSLDLFILDDGFQHRKLHRDLNILLIDSENPWGNGYLFPRGPLREPKESLDRADLIVLTKVREEVDYSFLKKEIRQWNTRAPILETGYKTKNLRQIQSKTEMSPDKLYDKTILAFAGIARPQSFQRTLNTLGAKVLKCKIYPDHHPYTLEDIAELAQAAEQMEADLVVTTEKDAVRLGGMDLPHPFWALSIEVELLEGKKIWDTCLHNLLLKQK